jgi:hypothetical protein
MMNPLRPSHRKRCYGHLPLSMLCMKGEAGLRLLNH